MVRLVLIIVAVTSLLAASVLGQTVVQQTQGQTGSGSIIGSKANLFSLFDPTRFQMSQSYSVSYFSGGGGGQMIAMYLNQIDYQIARPLKLSVAIGWVHQPQSLFGASTTMKGGQILPSFQLDWQPSKNFFVRFAYETVNPYVLNSNSRYHRRSPLIFDNR